MRSFALITALIGLASAVDFGLWSGATCTGALQICSNLQPTICCTPPTTYQTRSIQVVNKPATATAVLYLRNSTSACGTVYGTTTGGGSQNFCANAPNVNQPGAGAAYFLAPPRQRRAAAGSSFACTQSAAPDTLVLADGSRIDIQGMAADQVDAIMRLASGATYGAELPQVELTAY